jgi:chromosome partitioning protein
MTTRQARRQPAHRRRGPRIVAITNGKGGSGKTTAALGVAAMAGAVPYRTLLMDADRQGNAWVITDSLADPGYDCEPETDPAELGRLHAPELAGYDLVIVDTPGSLAEGGILGAVLAYADLAIVPTDMSVLAVTPTLATVAYVRERDCPVRVLLCGIPPQALRVEADAREYLAKTGPYKNRPGGVIDCCGGKVSRYAVHARALAAGIPVSRFEDGQVGLARAQLLQVLTEIMGSSPVAPTALAAG